MFNCPSQIWGKIHQCSFRSWENVTLLRHKPVWKAKLNKTCFTWPISMVGSPASPHFAYVWNSSCWETWRWNGRRTGNGGRRAGRGRNVSCIQMICWNERRRGRSWRTGRKDWRWDRNFGYGGATTYKAVGLSQPREGYRTEFYIHLVPANA